MEDYKLAKEVKKEKNKFHCVSVKLSKRGTDYPTGILKTTKVLALCSGLGEDD